MTATLVKFDISTEFAVTFYVKKYWEPPFTDSSFISTFLWLYVQFEMGANKVATPLATQPTLHSKQLESYPFWTSQQLSMIQQRDLNGSIMTGEQRENEIWKK